MQPAIRWYFSLSVAALLSFALLQMLQPSNSWAKEDEDEDDKVHDLMEKVHEGKKSPWKKGEAAAKQNPVDWATIKAALPRLQEMSKALQGAKSKEVRETADTYVGAVDNITKGIAKQDAAVVRQGFDTLANSCTDCHYKGGPGGKLD
jgi:cytochrome c556